MATRDLAVRFTTQGFEELRRNLSAAGKSFDEALKKAKDASQEAIAEARRAAGDTDALAKAQKAFENAARQANNAVAGSFRELRIKSTADIEAQKKAAVSAYEAIKKSGQASAQDIANARSALTQKLKELDKQADQTKGLTAEAEAAKALEEAYKSLGVTSNKSFEDQKQAAKDAFEAIKNSGTASFTELATARKAYHDRIKAIEAKQFENSPEEVRKRKALEAAQVIENAYKSLGVKSIADLEKQKREAIAAYEAIKNSGVASAKDIRAADKALQQQLKDLDAQINENAVGWEKLKIMGGNALDELKRKFTTLDLGVKSAGEGFTVLKGVLANLISGGIQAGLSAISNTIQSLTQGIIGFGQAAVNSFMQFDAAMNQFRAISQASPEQMTLLRKEVERLGIATSKTSTEIAMAAVELSKSGFSTEQVQQSLAGVVSASEASGESLQRTGEIIGSTLNQFQLPASESARVADVLAAAANGSATSIGQLGEGLKFVGALGGAANQSLEDVTVVLSLLSNAGLDASQTGTNFRRALIEIQKATAGLTDGTEDSSAALKKKQEMLRELGVQFRQADGQMRPFIEVLPELAKRMQALSPGRRESIAYTLFGTEGANAIIPLIGQVDTKLGGLVDTIRNAKGAAGETSAELQKGLQGARDQLASSYEVLITAFGEALAPSIEFAVRATTGWVNELKNVEGLLDPIKGLSEEIKKFFEENPAIIQSINQEMTLLVQDALKGATDLAGQLFAYLKENPRAIADLIRQTASFAGGVLRGTVNLAQSLLNYFNQNREQVAAIGSLMKGILWSFEQMGRLVMFAAEGWGKILQHAQAFYNLVTNGRYEVPTPGTIGNQKISPAEAQRQLKQAGASDSDIQAFNNAVGDRTRGLGWFDNAGKEQVVRDVFNEVMARLQSSGNVTAIGGGGAFASGLFTGPSNRIGGSSAYHIDTKIAKTVGEKAAVKLIDQMAAAYEAQGRVMEFSNSAVSGIQWDINASIEEKIALLKRLDSAHSHSPNPSYWDMDYYVPKKGQSRHGETVRGVEMMLPTVQGGRVMYGAAGNYGNFGTIYNAQGQVVLKTGHGDNSKPLPLARRFDSQTAISSSAMSSAPTGATAMAGGNEKQAINVLLKQFNSKMTADDFYAVSQATGVQVDALVTQAMIESGFGTTGRGKKFNNPLNWGNDDAGNNKGFASLREGLMAGAQGLKSKFNFTSPEQFIASGFKGKYGIYATDPQYKQKYQSALDKVRSAGIGGASQYQTVSFNGAAVNPMPTFEEEASKAENELEKQREQARQNALKRREQRQKMADQEAIADLKDQHEIRLEELKREQASEFDVRQEQSRQTLELRRLETKQAIAQLKKERADIEKERAKKLKTPAAEQTSEQKVADYSAEIKMVDLQIQQQEKSLKRTTDKITREFAYIAEDRAKSETQKQIDEYVELGTERINTESRALDVAQAKQEITQTELTYRRAVLEASRKQLEIDRLSQQLSEELIKPDDVEPTKRKIEALKQELTTNKEIAEINYKRAQIEQESQSKAQLTQFDLDTQKRRLDIAEQTGQISKENLIIERANLEIAGKQLEQQQAIAALKAGVPPEQKQTLELRIQTINNEIEQTKTLTEYQLEQIDIQKQQLSYQADYEQVSRLIQIAERQGNFEKVESLKLLQAQFDLENKIAEIKQKGLRPDQEAQAIAAETQLYELNKEEIINGNRNIGESLREMLNGPWSEFFQTAIDGTKSLSDAFNAMAQSVLSSLGRIGAEMATNSLMNMLGLGKAQQMQGLGGAIAGLIGGQSEPVNLATVGGGMFGDGVGLAESAVSGFSGVVPANNLTFAPSAINSPQPFTDMVQPPIAIASDEVTQALSTLTQTTTDTSNNLTDSFTKAIIDSTVSQTTSTTEFVASLQIARNAVISFAQSLPGGSTGAGDGGGILGTLAKGAIGAIGGALTGGASLGGFTAANAAAGLSTANAVASGSFGGFATLPTFKYGGEVEKLSTVQTFKEGGEVKEIATYKNGGMVEKLLPVPTFANGGKVDPLRTAIASAFKKEGSGAMLAVMHSGEHVLSDRQGEAQTYRTLEKHFGKNPLAKIPMPMFMNGGPVGSVESRLLSGLNSTRMPALSLPTQKKPATAIAGPVSNSVTVNINDRESRFYKQAPTIAREMANKLRG